MQRVLRTIAILGRADVAVGVVDAVRELEAVDPVGRRTVALYTDTERGARFVREADRAIPLGPGLARVEEALAGVDAVWVAGTPAVDVAALSELCARLQLVWIGPRAGPTERRAPVGQRRLEVPVLCDDAGATWALGVLDTSRGALVECMAGFEELEDVACGHAADRWGSAVFAWDGVHATFLGLAPVHPAAYALVEAATGLDLIKQQLHLAGGGALTGRAPSPRGWAIQATVCVAQAGALRALRVSGGRGIRVDTGWCVGARVGPGAVLARICASGTDRPEALARLQRALEATTEVVRGGGSTRASLLDELRPALGHPVAHAALLQAAIEVYEAALASDVARFRSTVARGRPDLGSAVGHVAELRYEGHTYELAVARLRRDAYRVRVGDAELGVVVERFDAHVGSLTCAGRTHRVVRSSEGGDHQVEVDGVPHRVQREDRGRVVAPAPAVVLSVAVRPGQRVEAGAPLVLLEAMKLETPVRAPIAGTVREVAVGPSAQVGAGALLVVLDVGEASEGARVAFPSDDAAAAEVLQAVMLGFDIDADALPRCRTELMGSLAVEVALVRAFTDIAALFQRRGGAPELLAYARGRDASEDFAAELGLALAHYGRAGPPDDEALLCLFRANRSAAARVEVVLQVLQRWLRQAAAGVALDAELRPLLDRLVAMGRDDLPSVRDLAAQARYLHFDRLLFDAERARVYAEMEVHLNGVATDASHTAPLVACPLPLVRRVAERYGRASDPVRAAWLELVLRRYYRHRSLRAVRRGALGMRPAAWASYEHEGQQLQLVCAFSGFDELAEVLAEVAEASRQVPEGTALAVDLVVQGPTAADDAAALAAALCRALDAAGLERSVHRVVTIVAGTQVGVGLAGTQHYTWRRPGAAPGFIEQRLFRSAHPMVGKRLELWRLQNFEVRRLPSVEDVYLFRAVARANDRDERLLAFAEVRDLTAVRDEHGALVSLPHLERMVLEALTALRHVQLGRPERARLQWNRVYLYLWPTLTISVEELGAIARKLAPATAGLGLEKLVVRAQVPDSGGLVDTLFELTPRSGATELRTRPPHARPLEPLGRVEQKVVRLRRRGLVYPYELVAMLAPEAGTRSGFPPGRFVEYDLDDRGALVPVDRPPGGNVANLVVGLIENRTERYPEGMRRVALVSDPSRAMGAIAEPECRRLLLALELAEELDLPVEWFAVCAGATIAMDTGTENLDWTARVLRRLIEATQRGLEINIVVCGINVGAQSYWNSEAAMLLHTRGVLIMTAGSAMVLTGKQALQVSGSVSAPTNAGIGGYDGVMGPNGEAQYWAPDVASACRVLLRHYEHCYIHPGERFPRRAATTDPFDRDVRAFPHSEPPFATVGEVFSEACNRDRKRPFSIRTVMQAVVDADHPTMERWGAWEDAEMAVVWDAHLGGWPVCLVGIESKPLPRAGPAPADGPDTWTAGTLFPLSSKKVARAFWSSSGIRPVVVLATLSGFDGSPESMRRLQLEYGAEIGRAVVDFDGPMVFCAVSRYHGGAYVVFSNKLNEDMEVAALEGSYASVIGGAPAAAVVFAREVRQRTQRDPRVVALRGSEPGALGRMTPELAALTAEVRAEKLGEVAEAFDRVHTVARAMEVGSLDRVVAVGDLRPYLIDAVERGIERVLARG